MSSFLIKMDEGVSGLLGQWNAYSTALAGALVAVLAYRIVTATDPDIHPVRLARQALPSMVRREGESAIYRSADLGGGELKTGLEVKEKGASKWGRGKDGDLRDVWRRVVEGAEASEGVKEGTRGGLKTILGSENVLEHKIDDVTRQINLIGQHISEHGGIRVAIYLPNSIEFIVTLFACSFYPNLTTVLIPFDVTPNELISMLRRSASDTVVAAPGAFPFDAVAKAYPALRNLIWVVDEGSAHMDWNEVPEGTGGSVNVATWQEIVSEAPADAGKDLPNEGGEARDVVTFWQGKPGSMEEMVRFSQANIVAGMAGVLGGIPMNLRMRPGDVFLPAERLTLSSTLMLTLAALFSNATVAFNSVAGKDADIVFASQGISPTVVVAAPEGLLKVHAEASRQASSSALSSAAHRSLSRTLSEDGVMPSPSSLAAKFNSSLKPAIGTDPSKLRLVFVAERAGADCPPLSSKVLSDLRVFTGARVVYALAAAKVAGAAAMSWVHDYREFGSEVVFGPPTVSCEIVLRDSPTHKTTDEKAQGEIIARGPCVAGGEAAIGATGRIREDNTLAYV